MSKSSNKSTGAKCCLSALITVVVIVVLLVTLVAVAINLTPAQLKIENKDINGTTLAELGLADTKFIDLIKEYMALADVKTEDVVTNGYDSTEEAEKAQQNLSGSFVANSDKIDYSTIFTQDVTYLDGGKLVSYNDTTIAYIINEAIVSAFNRGEGYEFIVVLKDTDFRVEEVTITKIDATTGYLTIVARALPTTIKADLDDTTAQLIPDLIYVEVNATFSVGTQGQAQGQVIGAKATSIAINNKTAYDSAMANAFLTVVANRAADGDINVVSQSIVDAAVSALNHLGKIGTADVDSSNHALNPVYGMVGIENHKVTMITHSY